MGAVTTGLQFLFDHADVIETVAEAVAGGSSKEAIIADIKAGMLARSQLEFEAELAKE